MKMPPLPKLPTSRKGSGVQRKTKPPKWKYFGPQWREDVRGNVWGECRECQQTHRAIDLALVPTWTGGYWYCRTCRPNAFKVKAPTVRVRG